MYKIRKSILRACEIYALKNGCVRQNQQFLRVFLIRIMYIMKKQLFPGQMWRREVGGNFAASWLQGAAATHINHARKAV
jgi:hypothetical protein